MAQAVATQAADKLQPIELRPLPRNPFVSILVANYNYGHFLGDALKSVIQQSYGNFELIVCDDGSTDDSSDIVLGFAAKDARIRLLRQANAGQSAALNAAYRESRGQIICLLDADDRFLPDKLDTVVTQFQAHPDSGFLAHRIFLFNQHEQRTCVIPLLWEPPSGWLGDSVLRGGDPPPGLVPTSGLSLRREVADLIWPLPESLRYGSDAVLCFLAPLITRIIGVSTPLAEYRCHGNNGVFTSVAADSAYEKQQHFARTCWEVQNQYLSSKHPLLLQDLLPLEKRMAFQLANYMRARTTRDSNASAIYSQLIRTPRFAQSPATIRWFWQLSILFPVPVLRWTVGYLWGQRSQGVIRELCMRMVRTLRRGKRHNAEASVGI